MEKMDFTEVREVYQRIVLSKLDELNDLLKTNKLNDPKIRSSLYSFEDDLQSFLKAVFMEEFADKINKDREEREVKNDQ